MHNAGAGLCICTSRTRVLYTVCIEAQCTVHPVFEMSERNAGDGVMSDGNEGSRDISTLGVLE